MREAPVSQIGPAWALSAGWSIIPLGLDKKPNWDLLPRGPEGKPIWKPYQLRLAEPEELAAWTAAKPPLWAMVTGAITGRITLDFDGEAGAATMRRLDISPHRGTPSGGSHSDFRHPGWYVPTLNHKTKIELGKRWPGLDIKGDGGYAAFAGHTDTGTYVWLRDPEPFELDILPLELREFLGLLNPPEPGRPRVNGNVRTALANSRVEAEHLIGKALEHVGGVGRNNAGFWLAGQLRDNAYGRSEAASAMQDYRSRVPSTNTKGQREEYTESEMANSLNHAYERPAREPWTQRTAPASRTVMAPDAAKVVEPPNTEPPETSPDDPGPDPQESLLRRQTPKQGESLPRIRSNNRQLRDVSNDALAALQAANDPPILFARSGMMVAIIRDEKQRQVIGEVGESALRGRMGRSANYFKITANGNSVEIPPPIEHVKDILALEPALWKFPPLEGVVEAPILRPDGSILESPGYDVATGLYYAPDPDLVVPPITERPTSEHVKASLKSINRVICDFPFVDKEKGDCASRANLIATLLSPIVKPATNSPSPLSLFDAPQAGSGKSLLAEVVSIVATGRPGEMFSAPRDEDEWRKQITMALKSGTSVVVIDNVNRKLDNPDLCKVLTETTHVDREFKTHNKLALPVKATFIATGNNIQIGGDMPRRCYWIRLDAETSQPFLRTGFKIEDLKAWTAEHRGELLAALLTLARAWYVAGKNKPKLKPLGSYEAWSITVGGILEHAGIKGFLGNASALYTEADSDSVQWEGFFLALIEVFYSEPFTTAQVAEKLQENTRDGEKSRPTAKAAMLRAALPEFLVEGLSREGFFQRRAGKCFAGLVDQRFGKSQVHLKRAEINHGAQQWKVVRPKSGS